jgi:hypothetical protein
MQFDIDKSEEILRRTPGVLDALLAGLSDEWVMNNEGPDTFSPFDVVGHLILGDRVNWIPRARLVLSNSGENAFEPFDQSVINETDSGKTIEELLAEFRTLRASTLEALDNIHIDSNSLRTRSTHPAFGEVTLGQFLSAWVVHDLDHIGQIVRVMAKQYKEEVGPWKEYLRVLNL